METRPAPVLDDEDHGLTGPLPRAGVSTPGLIIVPVMGLVALACLAGFLCELWRILPEPRLEALRNIAFGIGLALQWLALFGTGFYLVLVAGTLFENSRLGSAFNLEGRQAMMALTLSSYPRDTVMTAWRRWRWVALGSIGASVLFWSLRPLSFLVLALAFWLFSVVRISTPAAVVLLGTSDTAELKWHHALLFRARPLRVVSCLDITHAQAPSGSWQLTFDCFRSGADQDWWETVQGLIRFAPFVVVDGTVETEALQREVHYLAQYQGWKCLVLVGPDGESRLLAAAGVPRGVLCTVGADIGVEVVTHLLAQGELPTPERPVARLLPAFAA